MPYNINDIVEVNVGGTWYRAIVIHVLLGFYTVKIYDLQENRTIFKRWVRPVGSNRK